MVISNNFLKLKFSEKRKHFFLYDKKTKRVVFKNCVFGVLWQSEKQVRHETLISELREVICEKINEHKIVIKGKNADGWIIECEINLLSDCFGLECKVGFENRTSSTLKVFDLIVFSGEHIKPSESRGKTYIFENGWQSWSPSGEKPGIRSSSIPRFWFLRDINLGSERYKNSWIKGGIVSEMFGKIEFSDHPDSLVIGALTSNKGFTEVLFKDTKVRATCQAEINIVSGDRWRSDGVLVCLFDKTKALDKYAGLVNERMNITSIPNAKTGWCSWYFYGPYISEDIVLKEAKLAKKLTRMIPLEVILIDGGWCRWGNWLRPFKKKFPTGMESISMGISKMGFTPGLWLAPLICERDSEIYVNHPDWLIKERTGKPKVVRKITASSVVEKLAGWATYGLDPTNPDVQEYIRKVINTIVTKWNYKYLKLDFLYGVCMGGTYFEEKTRLRALRDILKIIRETAGQDVYILGCGCPLQAGLGIVDAMRIGIDTGSPILRSLPLVGMQVNTISYRRARQNIRARSFMHRRWWNNDPDCIFVSNEQQLHPVEIEAFADLIQRVGGQVFLGDRLSQVTEDRVEKYLRPLFKKSVRG